MSTSRSARPRAGEMPHDYDAPPAILCDVNVLIGALVSSSAAHARCRDALASAAVLRRRLGWNAVINAGVLRIASHPSIFQPPCAPSDVFNRLHRLGSEFTLVPLEAGTRHWRLFRQFVEGFRLAGAGVMDAWYAALAIEHDCEWLTCDQGFQKYPGLRLRLL